MQQFCTYGSVRGASGQPTSLPRQRMRNSMIANDTVKRLAAVADGLGIGPLSLRLFTAIGFPAVSPGHDSTAPLALWLASSSVAQFCAAGLVIGGSVVWLAADLAGPGRVQRGGGRPERDHEEVRALA
jgi:hypothetical protein